MRHERSLRSDRTVQLEWPDHLLSLDEWEKLPEYERFKVEVAEGVLALSPRPILIHQKALHALVHLLESQLPATVWALGEVEVVLGESPLTVRIPDIVAVPSSVVDADTARVAAADTLLAVDVLSDGTRRVDRVLKFAEYAEAGIPRYWLVDLDAPVTLTAYSLVDGHYEREGEFAGVVDLTVAAASVRIDLDTLTSR